MALDTRKSTDKYHLRTFRLRILFITNFPYAVEWPIGGLKILDGLPRS